MDTIEEVEFDYEAYTRDNPPDSSKFRPHREVRQERREAFRARLINQVNMELKHARGMRYVFISYCHEDMTTVDRLCQAVVSQGIPVWLDRNEIRPGVQWKQAIQQAIHHGAYFIACFSKESNVRNQTYMSEELTLAVEKLRERPFDKVWFIPVKLNECEIPDIDIGKGATLRDLQSVNLYKDWEAGIQQIINVMPSACVPPQEAYRIPNGTNSTEDAAAECVLLHSENGIPYFIPFQKVHWDATQISLTLLPALPAQTAFLSSLRARLRSVPPGSSVDRLGAIAFAHHEDAAWVKLREVAQISTESKTVWEVVLKEETVSRAYKHRTEPVILDSLTLDKVADMRAKRLLLDEKLESASTSLTQATVFDQMLLEAQIRGELSSQYGNRLQALTSPIPALYQHFRNTPARFKKAVRLISVLYLKLSKTVEDILQLDVELLNPTTLQVKFRGRSSRLDVNEEPTLLECEGICPLPE